MKDLHISQVDTIFANGSYPIEFLFYYKNGISSRSLRFALNYLAESFWPVFGVYENGRIKNQKYDEEMFFQEIRRAEIFDSNLPGNELLTTFGRIIPEKTGQLFFLTLLQYQNGTVIIARMNHLAGDGYSYFHFLSALAAISRSNSIPIQRNLIRFLYKPSHNRTTLKDFATDQIPAVPLATQDISRIEYLKYAKSEISDIISNTGGNGGRHISANDVLSAMILKRTVENQFGKSHEYINLNIPIDVRRKIKEYGHKFFGNGLFFQSLKFTCAEIGESEPGQIALKIRDSMPVITKKSYLLYLAELESSISQRKIEHLVPYDPDTGCLVTNLSRLPTNKLNFGNGTPDLIFTMTIAKNSAVILADHNFHILRLVF